MKDLIKQFQAVRNDYESGRYADHTEELRAHLRHLAVGFHEVQYQADTDFDPARELISESLVFTNKADKETEHKHSIFFRKAEESVQEFYHTGIRWLRNNQVSGDLGIVARYMLSYVTYTFPQGTRTHTGDVNATDLEPYVRQLLEQNRLYTISTSDGKRIAITGLYRKVKTGKKIIQQYSTHYEYRDVFSPQAFPIDERKMHLVSPKIQQQLTPLPNRYEVTYKSKKIRDTADLIKLTSNEVRKLRTLLQKTQPQDE